MNEFETKLIVYGNHMIFFKQIRAVPDNRSRLLLPAMLQKAFGFNNVASDLNFRNVR